MMRGLTHEELDEVVKFAQKHHKFGYVPDEDRVTEYPFMIKYIDVCYDSRDKTFWVITFRSGTSGICFRSNHWALTGAPKGWKYHSIYDVSMAYLKGEFKPKNEFVNENIKNIDQVVREALVLDCEDTGHWFIKDKFTGSKTIFGVGDAGKLAAYEHMYRNQRYDI